MRASGLVEVSVESDRGKAAPQARRPEGLARDPQDAGPSPQQRRQPRREGSASVSRGSLDERHPHERRSTDRPSQAMAATDTRNWCAVGKVEVRPLKGGPQFLVGIDQ